MISFSETLSDSQLFDLTTRPRRNRKNAAIRSLVRETYLHPHQLVTPLFIIEGKNRREHIQSMPGIDRLSIDLLIKEVLELYSLGIRAIDLFPVIPKEKKDPLGLEAIKPDNLLIQAVKTLKQEIPEMCVMVDVALDPFTSHGHDGLVNEKGQILNDPTLKVLAEMSVLAAQAGADVIAPSDMMDGRVGYIRKSLDREGFTDVSILSYAAKYASSFYGPFREALNSTPQFGDKKTYQMDPANQREALYEAVLDEREGADMLLVKPALVYLDIISKIRQATSLPIAAYHVSGEYSMVMAAAEKGWLDANKVFMESLLSIKRAGADFILTYTAKRIAPLL
ncbi:MAG: delta-aminolevulinic acid dehydratase [Chlamydiales bacterium 38-26]|nr:porphobilinogen synthase [Chlamydiales bacterium]OJV11328.1 MAG: delta-aminolevulinic acid dehydratase [Chlamydiales bacterium 38-26]